ncbi:flavin-containing monooxygenase [Propylenella binzhouense]|uniref:NAD(P)/FAD-dependent oxidoreductase n=1 Tax=Propylenella binzhouense TaxID=2555902 RepID=A0A964T2K6_9HYPH|nr:NAD(P)/FAD-dependent oxidoreductase [Propylenella binzhouense]MYZ47281.1 NAD(P)/FAD-dependent oxidoreductase [Propylenella binzhouense]
MKAEQTTQTQPIRAETDVVVVGAGFSGLYLIHKCREMGLSIQVFEAGTNVGGTWYWNRYPGARCDSDSVHYSFSFDRDLEQEWSWSEKFSPQPEILAYLNHVADRFDMRRSIKFDARVKKAVWSEETRTWTVTTEAGDEVTTRYFIMATGCLSSTNLPKFAGMEAFKGDTYHTGRWPHERVSFEGKRVAVIGTGSSALQAIPVIAQEAKHLTVFQRTAQFSIPAYNGPLPKEREKEVKANYPALRHAARYSPSGLPVDTIPVPMLEMSDEDREAAFWKGWQSGGFGFIFQWQELGIDQKANDLAAEFVRQRIRETVKDPVTAEKLCPKGYPIGSKRICVDTDYFETYNRPNVSLVDVSEDTIDRITETGVRLKSGLEYELDAIVYATGFDAMTGSILNVDIRGTDGLSIRDAWAAGPRTYLGLMTHSFPNMFLITGPGSPSVLSNMTVSIEQHVEMTCDIIGRMEAAGQDRIEPTLEEQDKWVQTVNDVASKTLHVKANSWYLGANIPGKPRVFMPYIGGVGTYREICEGIANDDYRGFVRAPVKALAAE